MVISARDDDGTTFICAWTDRAGSDSCFDAAAKTVIYTNGDGLDREAHVCDRHHRQLIDSGRARDK